MKLEFTSLENAISQLAYALDAYNDKAIQKNPKYKKLMRSAAIQSFEFTYELTLKMIKRYLSVALSNSKTVASMNFKDVIREAYKRDLVLSDVSVWDQYRENRGITSHTYNEEKAQDVFEATSEFLHEAQYVLSSLHGAQSAQSMMSEGQTRKDLESQIAKLESQLRDLDYKDIKDTREVGKHTKNKPRKTSGS